ncbi:MAG: metal ABC transporter permease [Deferribacteraceae bacterium]|jgi:manganese/zinc/iron transport system permease protein|nr:metal ABC transporter permease [Deferribacteraceae bacterium]
MFSIFNIFENYTLTIALAGAALLGSISGITGTLAMLKRQHLTVNLVSYAALPGIAIAFILTDTNSHLIFLIGAMLTGLLAIVQISPLIRKKRGHQDRILTFILSVFFSLGIVLFTFAQSKPRAAQAGIETFFFGQPSVALMSDLKIIAVIALFLSIPLLLFWKELLITAFDPVYAAASGISAIKIEAVFAAILIGNVAAGVQTIGVMLMGAMLTAPPLAARQWTNNIRILLFLSALFGMLSGIAGSALSYHIQGLPTGPAIIVCAGLITFLSFFFAPKRGLCFVYFRSKSEQASAGLEAILEVLYTLSHQHTDKDFYGHPYSVIQSIFPLKTNTYTILSELCTKGLAVQTGRNEWSITPEGKKYMEEDLRGYVK